MPEFGALKAAGFTFALIRLRYDRGPEIKLEGTVSLLVLLIVLLFLFGGGGFYWGGPYVGGGLGGIILLVLLVLLLTGRLR